MDFPNKSHFTKEKSVFKTTRSTHQAAKPHWINHANVMPFS
jgi:hypothetical protein